MSWQDKALAAFWAAAFANEPLDSHRRIEAAIAAAAASLLPSTDAPMDDNAITPPPELVRQWFDDTDGILDEFAQAFAAKAARWGADQELEGCVKFLSTAQYGDTFGGYSLKEIAVDLRDDRRPKPPRLKEQALEAARRFYAKRHEGCTDEEVKDDFDALCRALEPLDD